MDEKVMGPMRLCSDFRPLTVVRFLSMAVLDIDKACPASVRTQKRGVNSTKSTCLALTSGPLASSAVRLDGWPRTPGEPTSPEPWVTAQNANRDKPVRD